VAAAPPPQTRSTRRESGSNWVGFQVIGVSLSVPVVGLPGGRCGPFFGLAKPVRGRLHGAFSMCVFMSDKRFVAEACPPMSHASASNGLSDIETHIENAPCNQPLRGRLHVSDSDYESPYDSVHDSHTKGLGTPFATTCQHIRGKMDLKLNCKNHTQNRMAIRTQNCMCRRPLRGRLHSRFLRPFLHP
jgi:hypothetical protein